MQEKFSNFFICKKNWLGFLSRDKGSRLTNFIFLHFYIIHFAICFFAFLLIFLIFRLELPGRPTMLQPIWQAKQAESSNLTNALIKKKPEQPKLPSPKPKKEKSASRYSGTESSSESEIDEKMLKMRLSKIPQNSKNSSSKNRISSDYKFRPGEESPSVRNRRLSIEFYKLRHCRYLRKSKFQCYILIYLIL